MARMDPGWQPSVLLVDDEKGFCDILAQALSLRGFLVETAHSGEEGIKKAKAKPYDTMICDLMMPGMGGIMALETLKQVQPKTEVIVCTGFPSEESLRACKALGVFEYLTKPCDMGPLTEAMNKAIARKRSQMESF